MIQLYPNVKGKRLLTDRNTNGISSHVNGLCQLIQETDKELQYDFILFIRIDLCLKPFFTAVFDYHQCTKCIIFPSICFVLHNYHVNFDGTPRVSDTMLVIPNTFFHLLYPRVAFSLYHDTWSQLHELGIEDEHIDLIVNTYHDSDSEKDWNPLYYICNRPESSTWHSVDYFVGESKKMVHIHDSDNTMYDLVKNEYDQHVVVVEYYSNLHVSKCRINMCMLFTTIVCIICILLIINSVSSGMNQLSSS